MTETRERRQVNPSAIDDVHPSDNLSIVSLAFNDSPSKPNLPVILRLLEAWEEEPERVLAFFYRDNPTLIPTAQYIMGLDVLTGWMEGMVEEALEEDSFARMMVVNLGGGSLPGDPLERFMDAVRDEKYGLAMATLTIDDEDLAGKLGAGWVEPFATLIGRGNGAPYMTGQVLLGAMTAHAKEHVEAGLARAAEALGSNDPLDSRMGYLRAMGEAFSPKTNPHVGLKALVAPEWVGY